MEKSNFEIEREDGDTCEYEVCKKAMDFYKEYPYFQKYGWEVEMYSGSIYKYYKDKNYEKTDGGYKGAHLLVNKTEGIALTADMLTSIYHPFTSLIFEAKSLDGEGLCSLFKDVDIQRYSEKMEAMYPYMKAFASVYYWCGNMMPVICNWKGKNDEAVHKIRHLLKETEVDNKPFGKMVDGGINGHNVKPTELLPSWRKNMWPKRDDFVTDNYLEDYVDENRKIKKDILLWYKSESDDKKKKWLLINTKLIVQRSYRIVKKYHGKWKEEEHVNSVKNIFGEVFDFEEAKEDNPNWDGIYI